MLVVKMAVRVSAQVGGLARILVDVVFFQAEEGGFRDELGGAGARKD